tara:strand:+ start:43 stop:834 length:792 start_codon:yes stop_codon:yes gene_type:complete
METLLIEFAKRHGMEKAMQMLGLNKQAQNPKYAISFGGINLNPMNMLKRAGINQGIKSLTGGGKGFGSLGSGILPIVALAGLGMYRNPLRQGAPNFSPNLAGQIDYLSNRDMIGRNTSSGLMQYGADSVLRGQNVVSAFGTNNYQTQLQNYIDKLEAKKAKGYNTIGFGKFRTTDFTEGQQKLLDKALAEKKDFFDKKADTRDGAKVKSAAPTYTPPNIHSGGGGDGDGGANNNASSGGYGGGRNSSDFGGRFHGAKGGIASL